MYDLEKLKHGVRYTKLNQNLQDPSRRDAGLCHSFNGCPSSAFTEAPSMDTTECDRCLGKQIRYQDLIVTPGEDVTKDNFVDVMTLTIALK